MAVFVITALALLAAALGTVVVSAVVLGRHVRSLRTALQDASARVSDLATELQEETAVTSIEAGALQQRLSGLREGERSATSGRREG
jgi:hypothetical protein